MTTKIRRINLYSGPSAGKSTYSAALFSHIKHQTQHSVELVREYVKDWAYENRVPKGLDQWYISAQQIRREEIPLRNGVELVVTDCPLLLNCYYAYKNNVPGWQSLVDLSREFEKLYPSLNIVLKREKPFVQLGRFQNEFESRTIDTEVVSFLQDTVKVNNICHYSGKRLPELYDELFMRYCGRLDDYINNFRIKNNDNPSIYVGDIK